MSSSQQVAPIWIAVKPEHLAILEKVLKARNVAHIRKYITARSNSGRPDPIALNNYIDVYSNTNADGTGYCYIGTLDPTLPKYHIAEKPVVKSGIDDNTLRFAAERCASVLNAEFQQLNVASSSAQPQQPVQYVNNGQTIGFVAVPQQDSIPQQAPVPQQASVPSPFVQQ